MAWQASKAAQFIFWALKQVGKKYRLGAEAQLTPENFNNVNAFADVMSMDCSECIQMGLFAAGVESVTNTAGTVTPVMAFDLAAFQWERSPSIDFKLGVGLPGALLFVRNPSYYTNRPHGIGHVGISLGNGYVLEARGKAYGVTIGKVRSSFNRATKVRELYVPA